MNWKDTPKTELHLHLEGAAPPAFIRQLAQEKSVSMDGVFDRNGDYQWADFLAFLATYEAACEVLKSPGDYQRLVAAVLEKSAQTGVVYTEISVCPDFCGGGDLGAWREYFDAMCQAADASPVETRFTVTAVRHFGPEQARITSAVAAQTAGHMLTGFGMGGDENFMNPADFAYAFDQAREAGLGLTSHAGEIAGPQSVIDTLDHLKVSRIGHGVRSIEDPALLARLADQGIVLEVNPGSNVALSVYPDWPSHPINALRDAGVKLSVSTDDPPYFHTDMVAEYDHLHRIHGWGASDFAASNRIAMQAAFCDEPTRTRLLTTFQEP